jgi:lipid-A-disaccharide synthase
MQHPVVALLPGSREHELRRFLPLLLKTAGRIKKMAPQAHFLFPIAKRRYRELVIRLIASSSASEHFTLSHNSHQVMRAADVGILASGTATLEATLLGMPHIAFYQVSTVTYLLIRFLRCCRILTDDVIALPNLISKRQIVPELLQREANPARLARETLAILGEPSRYFQMKRDFQVVSSSLGRGESLDIAASTILSGTNRDRIDCSALNNMVKTL